MGKARNRLSPAPPEEAWLRTHLVFRLLASGTGREWISVVSNHQVCDRFLQQPVKNPFANTGDLGLIPGLGSSPGGGNGNPLQYSCLENPMDRGAWQTMVHRVTELDTTYRLHTSETNTPSKGFYGSFCLQLILWNLLPLSCSWGLSWNTSSSGRTSTQTFFIMSPVLFSSSLFGNYVYLFFGLLITLLKHIKQYLTCSKCLLNIC